MRTAHVLLICFNRTHHARAVLTELRKQYLQKLFVFQDGVRENNPSDIE